MERAADRLKACALPAAIFAVAFVAFAPALGAEFVNYDDDRFIVNNPHYKGLSFESLKWMFTDATGVYIPLTWLSLSLDHAIWGGMKPGGFHLTNLLLHSANAVLFYFLVVALLGTGCPKWIGAVGALFFAVHPLRVESVAWVTERRDLLSGTFMLLALLAYLRMARADSSRRRWYAASIACFGLSLFSKASAMALPVVLLAMDVYPLRRFVPGRRAQVLIEKVPYLLLSLVIAVIAAVAQRHGGVAASLQEHGVGERVVQSAYGLSFYVWKTVLPIGLSPLYPLEKVTLDKWYFIVGLVGAVLITGVVVALRRRRPELLVAWVSYAAIVSPVLGLLQSGPHLVADRFSYHSCMPWAIVAAAGLWWLWERRTAWRTAVAGTAGALAVVLLTLTFVQSGVWKNSITVWSRALQVSERNPVASYHRGEARMARRDFQGAIEDYDRALRDDPRYPYTYYGRAVALCGLGRFREGIADFTECLVRRYPWPETAYYSRGLAHQRLSEKAEAAADYQRSLETAPADWPYRAAVSDALKQIQR